MSAFDDDFFDSDDDFNPELFDMAVKAAAVKEALIPPGGGGPPPGDPSAMGGAPPPGGAPPMDPSQAGGAAPPPADPSLMGAPPAPAQPAAQPGMVPGMPPKKDNKAELMENVKSIRAEQFQLRALLVGLFKQMGLAIPDEAVLGQQPPMPAQDPNATPGASPAVSGAGAISGGDPAAAAGGGAPPSPGAGIGGFPMQGPPGDVGKQARSAAALAALLRADDEDEDDDQDRFWRRVPGDRLPDAPPEKMGEVVTHRAMGRLQEQPLLLALKARQATRKFA